MRYKVTLVSKPLYEGQTTVHNTSIQTEIQFDAQTDNYAERFIGQYNNVPVYGLRMVISELHQQDGDNWKQVRNYNAQ